MQTEKKREKAAEKDAEEKEKAEKKGVPSAGPKHGPSAGPALRRSIMGLFVRLLTRVQKLKGKVKVCALGAGPPCSKGVLGAGSMHRFTGVEGLISTPPPPPPPAYRHVLCWGAGTVHFSDFRP